MREKRMPENVFLKALASRLSDVCSAGGKVSLPGLNLALPSSLTSPSPTLLCTEGCRDRSAFCSSNAHIHLYLGAFSQLFAGPGIIFPLASSCSLHFILSSPLRSLSQHPNLTQPPPSTSVILNCVSWF